MVQNEWQQKSAGVEKEERKCLNHVPMRQTAISNSVFG